MNPHPRDTTSESHGAAALPKDPVQGPGKEIWHNTIRCARFIHPRSRFRYVTGFSERLPVAQYRGLDVQYLPAFGWATVEGCLLQHSIVSRCGQTSSCQTTQPPLRRDMSLLAPAPQHISIVSNLHLQVRYWIVLAFANFLGPIHPVVAEHRSKSAERPHTNPSSRHWTPVMISPAPVQSPIRPRLVLRPLFPPLTSNSASERSNPLLLLRGTTSATCRALERDRSATAVSLSSDG
nr:hypothetical protein CFP56_02732 [Quercus suber]